MEILEGIQSTFASKPQIVLPDPNFECNSASEV